MTLVYAVLANLVVIGHLAFVAFVVLGGLLVLRWPRLAWLHLPCAAWGALVELAGWICPLTPLEQTFRERAGMGSYATSFLEHYLIPLIYPAGLTPQLQIWLGGGVLLVNGVIYAWLLARVNSVTIVARVTIRKSETVRLEIVSRARRLFLRMFFRIRRPYFMGASVHARPCPGLPGLFPSPTLRAWDGRGL